VCCDCAARRGRRGSAAGRRRVADGHLDRSPPPSGVASQPPPHPALRCTTCGELNLSFLNTAIDRSASVPPAPESGRAALAGGRRQPSVSSSSIAAQA
jgi:hypothetical protein